MADLSKIKLNGTDYNFKDALARESIETIAANIGNIPTYTLSISSNVITLTPSSGTASSVTLPVYDGAVE